MNNFEPDLGYDPIEFEEAQKRLTTAVNKALSHDRKSSEAAVHSNGQSGSEKHSSLDRDSILSDIPGRIEKKLSTRFLDILKILKSSQLNRENDVGSILSLFPDLVRRLAEKDIEALSVNRDIPKEKHLNPPKNEFADDIIDDKSPHMRRSRRSSRSRSLDGRENKDTLNQQIIIDTTENINLLEIPGQNLQVISPREELRSSSANTPPIASSKQKRRQNDSYIKRGATDVSASKLAYKQISEQLQGHKITILIDGHHPRVIELKANDKGIVESVSSPLNQKLTCCCTASSNPKGSAKKLQQPPKTLSLVEKFRSGTSLIRKIEYEVVLADKGSDLHPELLERTENKDATARSRVSEARESARVLRPADAEEEVHKLQESIVCVTQSIPANISNKKAIDLFIRTIREVLGRSESAG